MVKTQNTKYECGCGKIYSSYPAFSNHKKNKHANHNQPGTNIPKPYNPKRGRPSFTLPQKQRHESSAYSALTCIQTALLKLQEQHKGLLSQADEQADTDILNNFERCEKVAANKTAMRLIKSIRSFSQTLVTHLNQNIGEGVVEYLVSLTLFLLDNLSSEEISLNWDAELDESCFKIDSTLFNLYYQQRGQLQKVKQLAKRTQVPFQLILSLTVLLSEYLCVLNISTSTLSIKL